MSQHVRIFYGWRVVYALSLVTTFTSGLIFYNLSVLLNAFVAERAFPVTLSSIATGVFFIAAGIAGLVAGYLIDRVDARIVIIVSACIAVIALGCVGLLREPWQLFVFYIAFGCSYGGVGLVPTTPSLHAVPSAPPEGACGRVHRVLDWRHSNYAACRAAHHAIGSARRGPLARCGFVSWHSASDGIGRAG
jgi:MFS family permease